MKIELGKDSFAELKNDIAMGVMLNAMQETQKGDTNNALMMVLEDLILNLTINGEDVTSTKMEAFNKLGAKAGGMKLLVKANEILEEGIGGADTDTKKK